MNRHIKRMWNALQRRDIRTIHRMKNHFNVIWPMCETCLRPVDEQAIVENRPGLGQEFVTIMVKHHGAEDRKEFYLGNPDVREEVRERDISRIMQRERWFNPCL